MALTWQSWRASRTGRHCFSTDNSYIRYQRTRRLKRTWMFYSNAKTIYCPWIPAFHFLKIFPNICSDLLKISMFTKTFFKMKPFVFTITFTSHIYHDIWNCNFLKIFDNLRVVQTQTILFLESMSEREGPDIQRLWNLMIKFLDRLKVDCRFIFRVVPCRIRLFPTLISNIKWLWCGPPLNLSEPTLKKLPDEELWFLDPDIFRQNKSLFWLGHVQWYK